MPLSFHTGTAGVTELHSCKGPDGVDYSKKTQGTQANTTVQFPRFPLINTTEMEVIIGEKTMEGGKGLSYRRRSP